MVSCYRILAVTSFVLKVRSWSGNNVPIYLYQMNVVFYHSCPVKRGQSLKAELSPWNVPSWIIRNRSHLAAPSGQGSHILPSSHPWWSQAPNPTGPVSIKDESCAECGQLALKELPNDICFCLSKMGHYKVKFVPWNFALFWQCKKDRK